MLLLLLQGTSGLWNPMSRLLLDHNALTGAPQRPLLVHSQNLNLALEPQPAGAVLGPPHAALCQHPAADKGPRLRVQARSRRRGGTNGSMSALSFLSVNNNSLSGACAQPVGHQVPCLAACCCGPGSQHWAPAPSQGRMAALNMGWCS